MLAHRGFRASSERGLWDAKVKKKSKQNMNLPTCFHGMVWGQISWMSCNKTPIGESSKAAHRTEDKKKKLLGARTQWALSSCRKRHAHGQRAAFTWKELGRREHEGEDGRDCSSSCAVHEVSNITLRAILCHISGARCTCLVAVQQGMSNKITHVGHC